MKKWISVNENLPDPTVDVWATDGEKVELGFRSYVDTDPVHWADFHFPVTHWVRCDNENEGAPMPPNGQGRVVTQVGELTDSEIKQIEESQMSQVHDHFNDELDGD
ncbi:MAG: hypothetical protein OQK94_01055 [Gammaproteobacteria bacterium]|nr:hypothetical protein [Gammaproteobacteria bacterium]MCW8839461.1 hypothetical protein [Gammaproteobacteria bacterium]MCW8992427.1 hypothetical protein [Gammaproteobacteria bacterium]